MESARKDISTIKRPINSASINAVKSRYRKTKTQPAMTKELPSTANTAKCPWCGAPGWHAKKSSVKSAPPTTRLAPNAVLKVYAAQHQHPARATFQPSSHQSVVPVTFNGVSIDSWPDTAANIDAMGPEHLSKLGLKSCDLEKVTDTTMAANQSTFTAVGKFPATITLGNLSVNTCARLTRDARYTTYSQKIDMSSATDHSSMFSNSTARVTQQYNKPHSCLQQRGAAGIKRNTTLRVCRCF